MSGSTKPVGPGTNSGIPVELVYDKAPDGLAEKLGRPGECPYTRGVQDVTCTAVVSGRCASDRASAPRANPTNATSFSNT